MKRLYNEYSAAPCEGNVKHINLIMVDAFQKVWDEVVLDDDVCPRDTEALCHATLATLFAENILRRAMNKRREERREERRLTVTNAIAKMRKEIC